MEHNTIHDKFTVAKGSYSVRQLGSWGMLSEESLKKQKTIVVTDYTSAIGNISDERSKTS